MYKNVQIIKKKLMTQNGLLTFKLLIQNETL